MTNKKSDILKAEEKLESFLFRKLSQKEANKFVTWLDKQNEAVISMAHGMMSIKQENNITSIEQYKAYMEAEKLKMIKRFTTNE